jgi:hypothetical protein
LKSPILMYRMSFSKVLQIQLKDNATSYGN